MKKTWTWLEGRPKPPSEYEELTVGLQMYSDALVETGIGTWDARSTALESLEWEDFRDPAQQYYRIYVERQDHSERALDAGFDLATSLGYPAGLNTEWVEALRDYVGAMSFSEWAVGMCHQYVQRFCLSGTLGSAAQLQVMDELRHAERDLQWSDLLFGEDAAKESWMSSEALQPLRMYLEYLLVVQDWSEVVVGANVVLEGLLQPWLREVYMNSGRLYHDPIAVSVATASWQDEQRHIGWADALVEMAIAADASNKKRIEGWISHYLPGATAAVRALTVAHTIDGITQNAELSAHAEFDIRIRKLGFDLSASEALI